MPSPAPQRPANRNVRPVHRIIGVLILVCALYLAVTGSVMQLVDLKAILSHKPGTDTEMIQIREGINGPGNYVVIQPADYGATPLPAGFDYNAALAKVVSGARAAVGDSASLRFVDLKVENGRPVGVIRINEKQILRIDPASGAVVRNPPPAPPAPKSIHLTFKVLHVLRGTSNWITLLHVFTGIGLFTLCITGLVLYFQMLRNRKRAGQTGYFWSAGGPWRSLHRGISVCAALFLIVISFTGTMLALDGVGTGFYRATHKDSKYPMFPPGATADYSSSLPDAKLPAMLQTTLSAGSATKGATPIKVVRLRYFNGIPQGILIAGDGNDTTQFVFNSETGARMSMTEPGYPETHYHLGWHEHEIMKMIHRGDAFGVSGRVMDLLSGFSLIYLTISGGVMYFELWSRRRRGGKTALFWA